MHNSNIYWCLIGTLPTLILQRLTLFFLSKMLALYLSWASQSLPSSLSPLRNASIVAVSTLTVTHFHCSYFSFPSVIPLILHIYIFCEKTGLLWKSIMTWPDKMEVKKSAFGMSQREVLILPPLRWLITIIKLCNLSYSINCYNTAFTSWSFQWYCICKVLSNYLLSSVNNQFLASAAPST